jgi:hypothetical protein
VKPAIAVPRTIYLTCLICILMPGAGAHGKDRLFQDDDLLEITIAAPFIQMTRMRDKTLQYPGEITFSDIDGTPTTLAIHAEVRGNNRLRRDVCKFPPVRLIFGDDAENTLFESQKRLKLVTQCDHRLIKFHNYLFREFLAYRMFNTITPQSYRVRLAKISYIREKGKPVERYGFFIEPKKLLAKRIGAKALSDESISVSKLDQPHLNKVSLFQYLIGNVDYAVTKGGNDECCHNVKLFKPEVEGQQTLAIPYDFDYSGLVDAVYALPNSDLRQRAIKERIYRGFCQNNSHLDENISLYKQHRSTLKSLIEETTQLNSRERRNVSYYVDAFYTVINERPESMIKRCRKTT